MWQVGVSASGGDLRDGEAAAGNKLPRLPESCLPDLGCRRMAYECGETPRQCPAGNREGLEKIPDRDFVSGVLADVGDHPAHQIVAIDKNLRRSPLDHSGMADGLPPPITAASISAARTAAFGTAASMLEIGTGLSRHSSS